MYNRIMCAYSIVLSEIYNRAICVYSIVLCKVVIEMMVMIRYNRNHYDGITNIS